MSALADAPEHIFGYTIGEDISDRDLQKSEKQFGRCKSFDTYTPVGPLFTPRSTSATPITLRQNGEVRQQARTSQMIYSVAEIVSFASQSLTLLPGRPDPDRNTFRGRADPGGRQAGGANRRWPPLRNSVWGSWR